MLSPLKHLSSRQRLAAILCRRQAAVHTGQCAQGRVQLTATVTGSSRRSAGCLIQSTGPSTGCIGSSTFQMLYASAHLQLG